MGIEWNYQIVVCADDGSVLGESIYTTNKNRKAMLKAIREVGLEVNTERTKYMVMSRHQNILRRGYNLLIDNKSFENVANFKYLSTAVTS
jgi:hypothetical protein